MKFLTAFRTWDKYITKRIRLHALRAMDADHDGLNTFFDRLDCHIVRKVMEQMMAKRQVPSALEERHWLEEAYRVAQHRGCKLGGWQLRFVLYYHYGRLRGDW